MTQRILTAAVGIPLALTAILLLPSRWFFVLLLLIVEVAAVEYIGLFRKRLGGTAIGVLPLLIPLVALLMRPDLVLGAGYDGDWRWLLGAGLVMTVGLGSLVLAGRAPVEESVESLGVISFGVVYLGVPLLCLQRLHEMGTEYLLLLLAVVWTCDSAAYLFGVRFGRHKMAPRISPAKSWEGLIAGIASAGLVVALWWILVGREGAAPGGGWGAVAWVTLALATALATVFGDLTESLLKRSQAVKDSGSILPGHGGVLDRIDGLIFAAPVWTLGIALLR